MGGYPRRLGLLPSDKRSNPAAPPPSEPQGSCCDPLPPKRDPGPACTSHPCKPSAQVTKLHLCANQSRVRVQLHMLTRAVAGIQDLSSLTSHYERRRSSQDLLSLRSLCPDQQFRANPTVLPTRAPNHLCGRRCGNESTCSRRAFALETLPAEHRTALRRLERHGRFDAARRAFGARLRARKTSRSRSPTSLHAGPGPLGLTGLTALRVVLELLVEEKELFPGGEDKFTATICAG
jgi:hypothetical protein